MCTALPDRGGLEESRTSSVSPNVGQTFVLWTRIAGYAALVVLMIAVGYVFMRRDQDKDQAYVVEGNIEPGGKKAILVLGSDEKVVLGDEAEETLLAGNTTVKKRREYTGIRRKACKRNSRRI